MTWDTDDITDDVIVQDGVFAYLFTAGGTIKKGQAVKMDSTNNQVVESSSGADVIGVADQNVVDGEQIAIYGPGNIVRACSAAALTAGNALYGDATGLIDASAAGSERVCAFCVQADTAVTSTNYVNKVLLV